CSDIIYPLLKQWDFCLVFFHRNPIVFLFRKRITFMLQRNPFELLLILFLVLIFLLLLFNASQESTIIFIFARTKMFHLLVNKVSHITTDKLVPCYHY